MVCAQGSLVCMRRFCCRASLSARMLSLRCLPAAECGGTGCRSNVPTYQPGARPAAPELCRARAAPRLRGPGHWVELEPEGPDGDSAKSLKSCYAKCEQHEEGATAMQFNEDGWCGCLKLDGIGYADAIKSDKHITEGECTICNYPGADPGTSPGKAVGSDGQDRCDESKWPVGERALCHLLVVAGALLEPDTPTPNNRKTYTAPPDLASPPCRSFDPPMLRFRPGRTSKTMWSAVTARPVSCSGAMYVWFRACLRLFAPALPDTLRHPHTSGVPFSQVLVDNFGPKDKKPPPKYHSCKAYCEANGLTCKAAWEEKDNDCSIKDDTPMTCEKEDLDSSDAICECNPKEGDAKEGTCRPL